MIRQFIIYLIISICALPSIYAQLETDTISSNLLITTITKKKFDGFKKKDFKRKNRKCFRRNPSFEKIGLTLKTNCDQICETYVYEKGTQHKLGLSSDYDQGILGIPLSPSGKSFLVYSSYDSPEFKEYYDYRAILYVYRIVKGKGLQQIQYNFNYYSVNWSLEDIVWVNNTHIALKIYEEGRFGNGENLKFKYLKAKLIYN